MKTTIKGLLSLLLFMCVLSLYNCEKDSVTAEVIGEENGQNSFFSKGKLNQFSKLVSYVDELKRGQKMGALNKNLDIEDSNNFTIIENEDISVFTGATSTTYTIPIHKNNQAANTFSNLAIKFSDSEVSKAILITYEPTQTYLDAIITNDQAPYSGYASFQAIAYDGSLDHLAKGCYTVGHTYCNYGGEEHNAGPNCTPSYMWTIHTIVCETDEPAAFVESNISGGSTGGNNGSSTSLPNDDEIVTTPLVPFQIINDCMSGNSLNSLLSQEMYAWLQENRNVSFAISSYLENTGCNEDSQNFVLTTIEEFMANNQLTIEEYSKSQVVLEAPETPIEDIEDYLSCFDTTQPAIFTIYVDQPQAGSRKVWTFAGGVGHSYIGIKQGDTVRILGLYPVGLATPLNPDDPRVYGDNSLENYDVSITKNISSFQLWSIVSEIRDNNSNYNLSTNNCSTFALEIGQLAGLSIPNTFGEWDGGQGNNPGDFGEDIRTNTQVGTELNLDGGTAPANNKNCK